MFFNDSMDLACITSLISQQCCKIVYVKETKNKKKIALEFSSISVLPLFSCSHLLIPQTEGN